MATAYGVVGKKQSNPLRHTFYIGPDGRLIDIDRNVSPAAHGADIALKLKELGVPAAD